MAILRSPLKYLTLTFLEGHLIGKVVVANTTKKAVGDDTKPGGRKRWECGLPRESPREE